MQTHILSCPLVLTLASLALLFVARIEGEAQGKLKLGVYYETLCPDSKRFVKQQLYPLLKQDGGEHVDVEFIPYGKATTTLRQNTYFFDCQHGKAECDGNKMHACAIKYMNKWETIHFIGCSMGKAYPPGSLDQCAREIGMDSAIKERIELCARSAEGDELHATHGQKTNSLTPRLFFVPTVTYNGVVDEGKLWQSLNNLQSVVCSEREQAPQFCSPRQSY